MVRRGRGPTVDEVGEFPLIERLTARLGAVRPDVVVGIGDDVAAVRGGADRLLLATCDVQVAGTHFLPERCDPHRLGRKAAAINLSDIASAGGAPTHFLASLVLPGECEVAFLEALYDGLVAEARRFGADVIGGNVSRGTQLTLDLTLLGEVAPQELLRRDGARPGDALLVTGTLGLAASGLHLTMHPGDEPDESARRRALDAFETPAARVDEARLLAAERCVTAMIDVSDGLAADLCHLCEASGVGVQVATARLPVDEATRCVAGLAGKDPIDWAIGGGEDYELLFTAPTGRAESLAASVAAETGTAVHVIGEIVEAGEGRRLLADDGRSLALESEGWRHF
jgi:thiamine-monophosphate kinase